MIQSREKILKSTIGCLFMKTRSIREKDFPSSNKDIDGSKIYKGIISFSIISFSIALAIMMHQWIVWGHFWDVDQTMHHEDFALIFMTIGIVSIFIGIISIPLCKKMTGQKHRCCRS